MKDVFNMTTVLVFLFLPVVFFSDPEYSFYPKDDAAVRLAFKHSGKRVVPCNEEERMKAAAEKYKETVKEGKGANIRLSEAIGCPTERHPLTVELTVDGKVLLDKAYKAAGMRHDMASYVYENVYVKAGAHRISVKLADSGRGTPAEFTLDAEADFAPGEVRLVWFDPFKRRLTFE